MKIIYFLVGNGWLLLAALTVLGKNATRHQPDVFAFFGMGGALQPATYTLIQLCCLFIGLACLYAAWKSK